MKNTLINCERLSALADGQLTVEDAALTLDWLLTDDEAQASWRSYHMLGDVMRSELAVCPNREDAFMQRMRDALAKEPARSVGQIAIKNKAVQAQPVDAIGVIDVNKPAANEAYIHWRWVGGFAALLAMVVVGWQSLNTVGSPNSAPQLAQVIVPSAQSMAALPLVMVRDETPVMIRDPVLDAFLAAHKQFGGTSAFQKPSGFLSNAVFEGSPR